MAGHKVMKENNLQGCMIMDFNHIYIVISEQCLDQYLFSILGL